MVVLLVFVAAATRHAGAAPVTNPQQAEATLGRIFRDFVDEFGQERQPDPAAMAGLVRELNGLSLYLWETTAQGVASNTPQTPASQRLHQMLAATAALQMILSTGLLNESPHWQSLKLRARETSGLGGFNDLDNLAPALGAMAGFLITDLNTPAAKGKGP